MWDHGSCNYQHQCYWKSDVTHKEAIFTGEVIFTFCYIYLICNKFASPRNITVWISLVAIKYKVDFPLTGDWNIRNKIMDFSSFEHFWTHFNYVDTHSKRYSIIFLAFRQSGIWICNRVHITYLNAKETISQLHCTGFNIIQRQQNKQKIIRCGVCINIISTFVVLSLFCVGVFWKQGHVWK